MSTEDLAYILISPMEARIVREATLISLLNDEKPVYCLIPEFENDDDVQTLHLKPWIPSKSDLSFISEAMFHPDNIEIFKLTWSAVPDWNYEPPEKTPEPFMVNTLNKLSIYAAQLMEARHITGFVFASQPWAEMPLLPNSLIVAAINPYKVSKMLHLVSNSNDLYRLENVEDSKIRLEDILPEIINIHNPIALDSHLEWLSQGWANTITGIAYETFKTMTTNSEGQTFETDHGSMNWDQYQHLPMEDVYTHNYDLRPTGLFRKLFQAYQEIDYQYLHKFSFENHPHHFHGDIPYYAIDNWYNISYFRDFINRLFDPFYEVRSDIIDAEDEAKGIKNRKL
jgi:hypothetical protein